MVLSALGLRTNEVKSSHLSTSRVPVSDFQAELHFAVHHQMIVSHHWLTMYGCQAFSVDAPDDKNTGWLDEVTNNESRCVCAAPRAGDKHIRD